MVFLKEFMEKVDFEEKMQTIKHMKHYPEGRVKEILSDFHVATHGSHLHRTIRV